MTFLSSEVFFVLLLAYNSVQGTLLPSGVIALDCGSQQTFTCTVANVAVWTMSGLEGISVSSNSGQVAGQMNARINTTETGVGLSSTITISGFNSSDDGGTIQCIDLNDPLVIQGMANISVEPRSCPLNFSANRDGDFTSANVTYQLATPPPVTSTTVTYCSTSSDSPTCVNMSCPSSNGTCTISGLDPCEEYNASVIPNNKCGSATGCGSMVFPPKGRPMCPAVNDVIVSSQNESYDPFKCDVKLTWHQPNTPPVTSTTVTYSSTSPPNSGNMTCTSTSPCTISGLDPGTEYQFTVIPNNNCGSPTVCTGNNATAKLLDNCAIEKANPSPSLEVAAIAGGVVGGSAGLAIIGGLVIYAIAVLVAVLCCASCEGRSYCQVFFCLYCCGGEPKRPSSTRPMPADDYADPKKVREKKEKEDKIQYAALEFSEQAGSSGENPIRSKEEPVQYTSVEQA